MHSARWRRDETSTLTMRNSFHFVHFELTQTARTRNQPTHITFVHCHGFVEVFTTHLRVAVHPFPSCGQIVDWLADWLVQEGKTGKQIVWFWTDACAAQTTAYVMKYAYAVSLFSHLSPTLWKSKVEAAVHRVRSTSLNERVSDLISCIFIIVEILSDDLGAGEILHFGHSDKQLVEATAMNHSHCL